MFALYARGNLITKRDTLSELEAAAVFLGMASRHYHRVKGKTHEIIRLNPDCTVWLEEEV